jgi:chemotaxis regulatin CheY-phosphate phosphatase CheZ
MAWTGRRSKNLPPATANQDGASTIDRLLEHQKAWEAFAACAVSIIPVLKKQMEAVTQQTERAAMDLMVHIRALASPATTSRPTDTSTNLSKIVMAMQFQDITQQKLEHVTQALDQWHKHLQALLKEPQDESAKQEIATLQRLEESYTMEEERRLHAAAIRPDYQEPVPIELEQTETEADSVTLF